MKRGILIALIIGLGLAIYFGLRSWDTGDDPSNEVNIYSYRQEILIRPLLDAFSEKTGIQVNLVSGGADALLERLKAEGMNSPADLLLTADVGRLVRAKDAGVLQPVNSEVLRDTIPAQYRGDEDFWFGLSLRARVIFIAPDRVDEAAIAGYEDLADPKWAGRICMRSSSNVYNQSLLASLIAHHGAQAAEEWAAAVTRNMARSPQGGDRDQIKAVAAGECDIAVANTYYYARMLAAEEGDPERQAAAQVKLIWPNNEGRGVHVNISGAGVTAASSNVDNAVALLEFLVGDEAQKIYARQVFEYPIKQGIAAAPLVENWGDFKADDLPLASLAGHNEEAVRIFDRVGWR